MPAPVINSYKRRFILRRWLATWLGGLDLLLPRAPWYVVALQLGFLVLPFALGLIGHVMADASGLLVAACVTGALQAAVWAALHAVSHVLLLRSGGVTDPAGSMHTNIAATGDEDDYDFDGCVDTSTWTVIVPPRQPLHAACCSLAAGTLSALQLASFHTVWHTAPALAVLAWCTLANTVFSLVSMTPADPATWSSQEPAWLQLASRPAYLSAVLLTAVAVPSTAAGVAGFVCSLPALHAFGVLPPVHVAMEWVLERLLVDGFAGSPAASTGRLAVGVASTASAAVAQVLLWPVLGAAAPLPSMMLGFLLAHPSLRHVYTPMTAWRSAVFLLLALVPALLLQLLASPQAAVTVDAVLSGLSIALAVGSCAASAIQRPFLPGNIVRNLSWKQDSRTPSKLHRACIEASRLVLAVHAAGVHGLATLTAAPLLACVMLQRSLRAPWQDTQRCVNAAALAALLAWTWPGFAALTLGTRWFIAAAMLDRGSGLTNRFLFLTSLSAGVLRGKKHQIEHQVMLIALMAVWIPINLTVLVVSAVLEAPVVPLFGLPLLILGFPRPMRMWPAPGTAATTGADAALYQQMIPAVERQVYQALETGACLDSRAGAMLMLRLDKQLVLVQVLERGLSWYTLSYKGLELAETSCHHVEATHVDNVFAHAVQPPRPILNMYARHTLVPCGVLQAKVWSSSSLSLTGVIDQPDLRRRIQPVFTKALVMQIVQYLSRRSVRRGSSMPSLTTTQGSSRMQSPEVESRGLELPHTGLHSPLMRMQQTVQPQQQQKEVQPQHRQQAQAVTQQLHRSISNESVDSTLDLLNEMTGNDGNTRDSIAGDADVSLDIHRRSSSATYTAASPSLPGSVLPSSMAQTSHPSHLLPQQWQDVACPAQDVAQARARFDPLLRPWLQHVCAEFGFSLAPPEHASECDEEQAILALVAKCFVLLEVLGQTRFAGVGADVAEGPSAAHITAVFAGEIPPSLEAEAVFSASPQLLHLVLKAYRSAFKLLMDQLVLGEEPEASDDILLTCLRDLDHDWLLSSSSSTEWTQEIQHGHRSMLALARRAADRTDGAEFTANRKSLESMSIGFGQVQRETFTAIWASLTQELLYATNDDDERYSIQAHPVLLRNLAVQSSDPPLGYPVCSMLRTATSMTCQEMTIPARRVRPTAPVVDKASYA